MMMKKSIILFFFLSGCTSIQYEGRFGKIHRYGLGTDVTVGRLMVRDNPNGDLVVEIENGSSIQSEAISAAVEGAVKGAMKSVKP